ncbi:MAG: DMP19 family protein [Lentisphaerae bacterium]|nr:DMP19 family protein [Lentisphaerota bacterium]
MKIIIIILIVLVVVFIVMNKQKKAIILPSAQTIDEALGMETTKSLIAINGLIQKKLGTQNYSVLSHSELVVLAIDWLQSDVNNGGYHQYFYNSYSDLAQEAVNGLREIGANRMAEITEKACSIFPDSNVPKDRNERQTLLEKAGEKGETILRKLDDEFFKYPDNINALLIEYIKKHKAEFK